MDKTKKQILLLVIIIVAGICYAINEYIISPEKLLILQKTKQIQEDMQKLDLLRSKSSEVVKLSEEVAKLKQVDASIDKVTVKNIDTPRLIYDFYNSCKKYGIKGENLVFQLGDINKGEIARENTSNYSSDTTNQNINNSAPTTNKTEDISKSKVITDLLKLTIELKVSGDKNRVEKYIRSLNTLTTRKINVKSIKLEATVVPMINNAIGTTITSNTSSLIQPIYQVEPVTGGITADIIFTQYIYNNSENIINPSNYSFFDGNVGFSNFSDMFK